MKSVRDGVVKPDGRAEKVGGSAAIEQWDGGLGPGPVNALLCTGRAMELAALHGLGCVALANTNHWLRGGTYGWKAARAGFVFIGWSNTIANMPAWGALNGKLGNNPLVIAVPFGDEAIVLDMAMSQYSYGALEVHDMKNSQLPFPGGFDSNGTLTTDPSAIRKSQRALPIGLWKGAGLSLLLDILASILSSGLSVSGITEQKSESRLSQVFIAIDINKLANYAAIQSVITAIINDYHQSVPIEEGKRVRYPGEQVLMTRAENAKLGIPVLQRVWDEIKNLA
jgi:3-dehydro-L-gulonate 2-dehydrogenase